MNLESWIAVWAEISRLAKPVAWFVTWVFNQVEPAGLLVTVALVVQAAVQGASTVPITVADPVVPACNWPAQ